MAPPSGSAYWGRDTGSRTGKLVIGIPASIAEFENHIQREPGIKGELAHSNVVECPLRVISGHFAFQPRRLLCARSGLRAVLTVLRLAAFHLGYRCSRLRNKGMDLSSYGLAG